MIVEVITSGNHSWEKFEGIFPLKDNYYLLKSYFLDAKKESKCQWNLAKSQDGENTFDIVLRLGSCEIYDEDGSINSFKKRAMETLEKNS